MKKFYILAAIAAANLGLTGCGTTGQTLFNDLLNNLNTELQNSGDTSNTTNMITSVLGAVTTSSAVTASEMAGTWSYNGSKCYFESENILAQLGGQAAVGTIEKNINTQIEKVGIKKGACTFTFNNGQFSAVIGSKKISGTYKLDEANGKLTLSTAYGFGNITCNVSRNGNTTLNLLFPADKLLQMAQLVGTLTGGTSLSALSSLLGNYNGMQVGLQLYKQKN